MRKTHIKGFALAAAAVFGLLACGSSSSSSDTTAAAAPVTTDAAADYSMLKVAVVYIGVPDDKGWTYQHEQGILALEAELGITVKRVTNVPEGDEGEAIMEGLAAEGYNLIFATSFGYGAPMARVAVKHPEGCFEWATGAKFLLTKDAGGEFATFGDVPANLGTYFGAAEEARYLSGIAAGKASKSGKLGYVAAFPIPEVIRGINAFTLGAQSVNPAATVQVSWTKTWFGPDTEKQAAESLLAAGADVLAMHQDTTATGLAADAKGAKWVGYSSDVSEAAPNAWLTAPTWNWGPYYIKTAKSVAGGTCPADEYYGSMADGMVTLGSFGSSVDADTQALIATKAAAIIDGSFAPFQGPVMDQDGKEVVAAGAKPELLDLLGMSYFVKGVIGSPKG
ncbi:MAG: BMP family ABC transporter substrate-binding protein [Actinobacteria bacterium]|nr:MAG: BMP family ABC transporter substrate-binding protein [Actinomycetota bacterium]